jgi:hypothetical protein
VYRYDTKHNSLFCGEGGGVITKVDTGTYSELLLDVVNAKVRVHLEHLEGVEVAVGVAGLQQSVNLLLRGHRRVSRLSLNHTEFFFNSGLPNIYYEYRNK